MRIKKDDVVRVKPHFNPVGAEHYGGIVLTVVNGYVLVNWLDEHNVKLPAVNYDPAMLETLRN